MKTTTLPYWGQINAFISQDSIGLFTTNTHDTFEPNLYRLDTSRENPTLTSTRLPVAMNSLCAMSDGTVILMGDDGHFYQTDWQAKKVCQISQQNAFHLMQIDDMDNEPLPKVVTMASVANIIAVLYPQYLLVWLYQKHTLEQNVVQLPLETTATAMSLSADGEWLVIGDSQGVVTSYYWNAEKTALHISSSAQFHQGDVTALMFEPVGQQFFSAGTDKQLLRTHVQGNLQPINRGKASQHTQMIRSMLVTKQRLFTASDDKTLKSWQFDKGQPNTCHHINKANFLANIRYIRQNSILTVGTNQSFYIVAVDDDGKLLEVSHIIKDGYQRLKDLLNHQDDSIFQQGIQLLATQKDKQTLNIVEKALENTTHAYRKEQLMHWIIANDLPKTINVLEQFMQTNATEKVRQMAFSALKQRVNTAKTLPNYLKMALESRYEDVNDLAIQAYLTIAQTQPHHHTQIVKILQEQLNHNKINIRKYALFALEELLAKDSPKANLLALSSQYSDVKQAGLIRLYQRNLLNNLEVKRQLVILQNSDNALVRQTAFYVAILTQPELVKTLKNKDAQLTHILQDFADFRLLSDGKAKNLGLNLEFITDMVGNLVTKVQSIVKLHTRLTPQELEPLLQGLSNSNADINFRSAYSLALLQDERSLGALLRLMTDKDNNIRQGVAKAFGELGLTDAKAVLPMLLNDEETFVRQTAMQSYGKLEKDALAWVKVGFSSQQKDIHQQALAILLQHVEEKTAFDAKIIDLFTQALNNPFKEIRQEVSKVLINQVIKHDVNSAIHLFNQSQFIDIHQIAFSEWQATFEKNFNLSQEELKNILQIFFANPFKEIRKMAFDFALKQHKRIKFATLIEMAFASPFVDVRQLGLLAFEQRSSQKLMPLLTTLLTDDNQKLRLKALNLALTFHSKDVLNIALTSHYPDVQLTAAQALARQGNVQSYVIFEKFLQQPKPILVDEISLWKNNIQQSLMGLAELADSRGFVWFDKYLHDTENDFSAIALYVSYVTSEDSLEKLATWLQDERDIVSTAASLALAIWGDKRGEAINHKLTDIDIYPVQWLQARNGLGIQHASQLTQSLNHDETALASGLLLAFYDLLFNPNQPKRLLEALAIARQDMAIFFAGIIARYAQPSQVWQYIADKVNYLLQKQRNKCANKTKQEKPWALDVKTLQNLARFVVFGSPIVKATTIYFLIKLHQDIAFETWQTTVWQPFFQRYHTKINVNIVNTNVSDKKLTHYWQALAFSTWLGVLRQTDYSQINLASQAIHELMQLTQQNMTWQTSLQQAFIPLLNHTNQSIRELAWEKLEKLQTPADKLGEQAMNSPYAEIVQKGLTLWLSTQDKTQANQQLQDLLQTSSPLLTKEAYSLLIEQVGLLTAGLFALEAYYVPLRQQVVREWQRIVDSEFQADKITFLNKAIHNDDWQTSYLAFKQRLAMPHVNKKDYQPVIFELWQNAQNNNEQYQILQLIQQYFLKENIANNVLDLLDNQYNLLSHHQIYSVIAEMRDTSIVAKLLARYQQKVDERSDIYETLLTISGFDQSIIDYNDELNDKRWLEQQYPRHADILLQLAQELLAKTAYIDFIDILKDLAWINDNHLSANIDNILLKAFNQLPNNYTAQIVQAIAYRAEKRQGSLKGLRKALAHRDNKVQFLAAEGLAKVGVKDGFATLMAMVDYHDDADIRRRAVLALGLLADEQAFDKLIRLAEDDEHYLQDVASEALGHLGKTDYGQRIFNLLKMQLQQCKNIYNPAIEHWINGLRWLNTFESWQQIRLFVERNIQDNYLSYQQKYAISSLQYQPDEANQQLLLKLLRNLQDDDALYQAFTTAQLVWGNDKEHVYPYDWAVLLSINPMLSHRLSLNRIIKYASFEELITFINRYQIEMSSASFEQTIIDELMLAVLNNSNLSIEILQDLLNSEYIISQQLGLRYLMKNPQLWQVDIENDISHQFDMAKQQWTTLLQQVCYQPDLAKTSNSLGQSAKHWQQQQSNLSTIIEQFIWLLMRHTSHQKNIVDNLQWLLNNQQLGVNQAIHHIADVHNLWLQQALLALLARNETLSDECYHILAQVKNWTTAKLEQLSQQLLQGYNQSSTTAQPSLLQRLNYLFSQQSSTAETLNPNQQLLHWVQIADIEALFALASDNQRSESLRISAIEGLGQINSPKVVQLLQQLQQNDPDADIQRTAFMVLRRYQRRQSSCKKYASSNLNDISSNATKGEA